MALPTTISGIALSTTINQGALNSLAGMFLSSAGNVYFIGASTTAGNISAQKATDPTVSFSGVGTDPTITNANTTYPVACINAWQDGDLLHVVTATNPTTTTNADYYYHQFDMSSDSWVLTNEAIATGLSSAGSAGNFPFIDVCKRSVSGEIVVIFTELFLSMSNNYQVPYYSRRTGTATWTTPVAMNNTGSAQRYVRVIADPVNDRVIFGVPLASGAAPLYVLSAANVLSAGFTTNAPSLPAGNPYPSLTCWNVSGTIHCVWGGFLGSASFKTCTFTSADSLTLTAGSSFPVSGAANPSFFIHDGTNTGNADVWCLGALATDSDMYAYKSTNSGSSFGTGTNAMTATIVQTGSVVVSIGGEKSGVFARGGNYVIAYIVNDNGTLKYNEFIVRSAPTSWAGTANLTPEAILGANLTLVSGGPTTWQGSALLAPATNLGASLQKLIGPAHLAPLTTFGADAQKLLGPATLAPTTTLGADAQKLLGPATLAPTTTLGANANKLLGPAALSPTTTLSANALKLLGPTGLAPTALLRGSAFQIMADSAVLGSMTSFGAADFQKDLGAQSLSSNVVLASSATLLMASGMEFGIEADFIYPAEAWPAHAGLKPQASLNSEAVQTMQIGAEW